uniref:Uncharacterized protein n=1 Tax=Anopheles albimanus TaxID=7167 RepID=A0A182FZ91_ANOAL
TVAPICRPIRFPWRGVAVVFVYFRPRRTGVCVCVGACADSTGRVFKSGTHDIFTSSSA